MSTVLPPEAEPAASSGQVRADRRSDDLEPGSCRARREIMTGHTSGKIALIP